MPCVFRLVRCFFVAKRTQSCNRASATAAKSRSTFGSSRPSPAFATVSRITSAGHSRNASRMYHTFPRDFDILTREAYISVHAVAARPVLLRKDRDVIKQAEGHMILDQVLRRIAQVYRVPVRKLLPQLFD